MLSKNQRASIYKILRLTTFSLPKTFWNTFSLHSGSCRHRNKNSHQSCILQHYVTGKTTYLITCIKWWSNSKWYRGSNIPFPTKKPQKSIKENNEPEKGTLSFSNVDTVHTLSWNNACFDTVSIRIEYPCKK